MSIPSDGSTGDVLLQGARRTSAVGAVAAVLWAYSAIFNTAMLSLLGHPAILDAAWPYPGVPISLLGMAAALLLILLSRIYADRPERLLDLSAGFTVGSCLLVALLTHWVPPPVAPLVSWLCVIVLIYPALVPMTPRRTLVVSLLAALMDPVALGIAQWRGVSMPGGAYYYLWSCSPTFICALISVVPARIIRTLGQQVRRARALGSYRLEEVLGRGGMGEVYRATHQMLARPAAIKVIRSEVLRSGAADGGRVVMERFRREAEASALLRSPHTIDLYDFGLAQDGTFFLVMELLEGLDLQTLVDRFGPQPPERTAHLLAQACASLEEAHVRGLIHRDIKPSNLFTCRMGLEVDFIKVLDFGLVKSLGEHDDPLVTGPHGTAGTPAFMAPEVARGEQAIDHRVDIYALGCVGYWLLTGRLVFEAKQSVQMMMQHISAQPVPPSERTELEIPPALDAAILACLAKDPAARPCSAAEFARLLREAVPAPDWDGERAKRWWERHHPDAVHTERCPCEGMTLTKAIASGTPA